jgi:hypothetical protein
MRTVVLWREFPAHVPSALPIISAPRGNVAAGELAVGGLAPWRAAKDTSTILLPDLSSLNSTRKWQNASATPIRG